MVVDDVVQNIDLVRAALSDTYRIFAATDGLSALNFLARGTQPDLILLDVMMPGLSGYETLAQIRKLPGLTQTPVIFVTAMHEATDELKGLALGAVDYISKPYQPLVLKARVANAIELADSRQFLSNKNAWLESEIVRHLRDRELVQDVSLRAITSLAEARDNETGNHILRTQHYVKNLALQLRENSRFAAYLSDEYIECLFKAAPLHDIGKVGISDHILLKPDKLTDDEFHVMKSHAVIGADAIERALIDVLIKRQLVDNDDQARTLINAGIRRLSSSLVENSSLFSALRFLLTAREIARWHHERWDGSGYPDGLQGDAIPLSAQLMAVADVFDALISKRVYKPAFPLDKVVSIIASLVGTQFDPDLIVGFNKCMADFERIAKEYRDHDV